MQVNVNKQLTTNILTHMITLNWRTFDTFHSFQTSVLKETQFE